MTDRGNGEVKRIEPEIRRFVSDTYGFRGTFRLHRAALGLDLLRAPANVALAPLYLLQRLIAALLGLLGRKRAANWLARHNPILTTDVSRAVTPLVTDFLYKQENEAHHHSVSRETIDRAVDDYVAVRNAVAEITTSLIVIGVGVAFFRSATPGVVSLARPVADVLAHAMAVAEFPLGARLGRLWYDVFPVELTLTEIIGTGIVLAAIAAVVTTFAGLLADPIQVWTGTHRRRLARLVARLEQSDGRPGIAREHLAARIGDGTDLMLSLWRMFRG